MGHTMTKQSWEWKKSEQEEFRLYLVSQERSENTVEKYLRDVRRFCAHIGKDTIGDIEREDVLCYKKWLLERYKTASVNSMLAALNCCFRFLKRDELCVQNCRVQRLFFAQEEREMSREEYFCLVREARRQGMEREAAILQTMASTGVRVSELPFITAEAVRELAEMYSEALSVLDANTVKYMVEQQQEEIERQRGELIQKKNEIDTLKKAQEQKDAMLARQENTITCQEEEIARLKAQLAAKENAEA